MTHITKQNCQKVLLFTEFETKTHKSILKYDIIPNQAWQNIFKPSGDTHILWMPTLDTPVLLTQSTTSSLLEIITQSKP